MYKYVLNYKIWTSFFMLLINSTMIEVGFCPELIIQDKNLIFVFCKEGVNIY